MKKMTLKEKVGYAWFKKTGKHDGWEVYRSMVGIDATEDIARAFGVALMTAMRWSAEYKQEQEA